MKHLINHFHLFRILESEPLFENGIGFFFQFNVRWVWVARFPEKKAKIISLVLWSYFDWSISTTWAINFFSNSRPSASNFKFFSVIRKILVTKYHCASTYAIFRSRKNSVDNCGTNYISIIWYHCIILFWQIRTLFDAIQSTYPKFNQTVHNILHIFQF